ncbi:MAG TPA: AMP-binding protein, partial [Ilumatobacteraceae bacterium]|nr:AMP-binding protein [Ilumatobacteraceae bacterium]
RIAAAAGTPLPVSDPDPLDTSLLGFTSGSPAGPKACIFTHRRLVARARVMVQILGLTADDAIYEVMPLFHNTGVAMCWLPGWVAGSTHVMRPKFSASAFLPDVRRYGVTFFAYVGKVLSYILATSEGDDDTDNGLLRAMGVEGSAPDVARFAERFDCAVRDAYGATEGGITVHRTPDMPAGALGRPVSNTTRIVNPDSGRECAVAELDVRGRLLNPDEAIGEMVERADVASFEGYYNNDAANAERIRDGLYWSGDLAYRDQDGLYWFAGRGADMIRVDGENLGTAPIEAILDRYPGVVASAAYATPAVNGSDDLMVCLELVGDVAQRGFDPADFRAFLDAQPDLSPKMVPRFVRVTESMPMTGTSKIDRRTLRAERWATDEPIWWRPERSDTFVALTADDASALAAEVVRRGRDWGVTPSQTAQEARR